MFKHSDRERKDNEKVLHIRQSSGIQDFLLDVVLRYIMDSSLSVL